MIFNETFQAIVSHLKNADTGRVVISRGRAHQTKLEALVACAQLSGFQVMTCLWLSINV